MGMTLDSYYEYSENIYDKISIEKKKLENKTNLLSNINHHVGTMVNKDVYSYKELDFFSSNILKIREYISINTDILLNKVSEHIFSISIAKENVREMFVKEKQFELLFDRDPIDIIKAKMLKEYKNYPFCGKYDVDLPEHADEDILEFIYYNFDEEE